MYVYIYSYIFLYIYFYITYAFYCAMLLSIQIFCDGVNSCNGAIIVNFNTLEVWGQNSLRNAIVTTNGGYQYTNNSYNNNTITITIHDDINGEYSIICNDSCVIDCQSEDACFNLNLSCPSNQCNVKCNDRIGML